MSRRVVDGHTVVVSCYADIQWKMVGQPTNKPPSDQIMNFARAPAAFRETMKAIAYRYMCQGREGQRRPSDRAIVKLLRDAEPFLKYLESLGIERLADVTAPVCSGYVEACRRYRQPSDGKGLKAATLGHRFTIVEALHELSQCTEDAMVTDPWPGTSSTHLAGLTGRGTGSRGGATPLMPDEVFIRLFQEAWVRVEGSDALLTVRDEWLSVKNERGTRWSLAKASYFYRHFVKSRGWASARSFSQALHELRTACYIVVASLSGCRHHELAFIESGACYRTTPTSGSTNAPGEVYWWMRSQSTKTGEGRTEWMIPQAASFALQVLEHWAKPYQAELEAEIASRRAADPLDPEIAEAARHRQALFLCAEPSRSNQVRTASVQMMNIALKAFAKRCGLEWAVATHQFRRKFANYAARSQFGDLRYLKQHFKHWSLDMTLGYALNESQEMALYAEIEEELGDIKAQVVASWLKPNAPLAGGYGANIAA